MKILSRAPVIFAASLALLAPAYAADSSPDNDRVDALLHQSGYKYEQRAEGVWVVPQHGDNLGDFKVIVATGDGLAVIFVIVAKKADIDMNLDLATKMLSMNHEYDRVKVGIDGDGDFFVRDDASVRVLDETEFKEDVHQVAASADEIYGALSQYLK